VTETGESAASKKPQEGRKQGSETVLLVEDDAAVRELVDSMLAAHGYSVLVSQDPQDVETICERHPGRVHLLLTDMVLPGLSGREIAKRVGSWRPEAKVLFMSGYADDALIHSHGFEKAFASLQKSFSSVTLAAKIREVLDADGFDLP
jgi:two-component system, cell cycle sensor histidine kinase and response regulator CckA